MRRLRNVIGASSLPEHLKERLLRLQDQRITKDGIVHIKAQAHRSQEKNKQVAQTKSRLVTRRTLHGNREKSRHNAPWTISRRSIIWIR